MLNQVYQVIQSQDDEILIALIQHQNRDFDIDVILPGHIKIGFT